MSPSRIDEVMSALRATGARATIPRRAIVEVVVTSPTHLSADEIVERVHRRYPEVNESTVYRTLQVLEELGVLYHVHLGHGSARWHLAERPHHHLVCESCQRVIEMDGDAFAELRTRVAREHGFSLDPRHFALVGRCSRCAAED